MAPSSDVVRAPATTPLYLTYLGNRVTAHYPAVISDDELIGMADGVVNRLSAIDGCDVIVSVNYGDTRQNTLPQIVVYSSDLSRNYDERQLRAIDEVLSPIYDVWSSAKVRVVREGRVPCATIVELTIEVPAHVDFVPDLTALQNDSLVQYVRVVGKDGNKLTVHYSLAYKESIPNVTYDQVRTTVFVTSAYLGAYLPDQGSIEIVNPEADMDLIRRYRHADFSVVTLARQEAEEASATTDAATDAETDVEIGADTGPS